MKSFRDILISALALMIIGALVTAALAGTNALTKDTITKRTEEVETAARKEVIVAESFQKAELKVDGDTVTYYVALQGDETVGYVFTNTAVGKSSGLVVMTGISVEGKVTGVKITDDNETAGYVDKVEKRGFLQKLVGWNAATEIKLGKGEGEIEAVSQATKTSDGVRKAVNEAMSWYKLVKGGGADE